MKINEHQLDALETIKLAKTVDYPFGENCPSCNRPHLFSYEDGTKLCHKCDELIILGDILKS